MAKKKNNEVSPWWVIALKTLAYVAGLLLAGVGTTTTASAMGLIP